MTGPARSPTSPELQLVRVQVAPRGRCSTGRSSSGSSRKLTEIVNRRAGGPESSERTGCPDRVDGGAGIAGHAKRTADIGHDRSRCNRRTNLTDDQSLRSRGHRFGPLPSSSSAATKSRPRSEQLDRGITVAGGDRADAHVSQITLGLEEVVQDTIFSATMSRVKPRARRAARRFRFRIRLCPTAAQPRSRPIPSHQPQVGWGPHAASAARSLSATKRVRVDRDARTPRVAGSAQTRR